MNNKNSKKTKILKMGKKLPKDWKNTRLNYQIITRFYDSIKLQTQFEILFNLSNQLPTKQNLEI